MRGFKQMVFVIVAAGLVLGTSAILMLREINGPDTSSLIGKSRSEILRVWGEPSNAFDGHYGKPRPEDPSDPVKSMVFDRWQGSVYVSMRQEGGEWICFSSTWLPKGSKF